MIDINAQRMSALRAVCADIGANIFASTNEEAVSEASASQNEHELPHAKVHKQSRRDASRFVSEAAKDVRNNDKRIERKLVCTGNQMVDQFQPWSSLGNVCLLC